MDECKGCKYWKAAVSTASGRLFGECKRYPPTTAQEGLIDRRLAEDQTPRLIGAWLLTESSDSCGEYALRPKAPLPSKN